MTALSSALAAHLYTVGSAALTAEDILQLRKLLLDLLGAMFAGYKQNRAFADSVQEILLDQGGKPEASVFMQTQKYPARTAAFLNALYSHGAELDDGNKSAMGHVGVHVIPAVLALAEAEHAETGTILSAIVVGYEAYIRISAAAQPGMVNRGFHSTGMAGAPACAAACAVLLGLDASGIENAMSFACTMSSGLLTYSESQQMIKPINPAKAAETGVFAARLAAKGLKAPENCLEGANGWFRAVTEQYDAEVLLRQSPHLLIHDCYFKLYPSCRHTHCGIEAAVNLHQRNKSRVQLIQHVDVRIYPNAIKLAGQIYEPQDADETKFSIHYTLACGLLFGEYGVDYMNPPRMDALMKAMIQKIRLIPDESMENRAKHIRGTSVTVTFADGTQDSEMISVPKGDPEKPLTTDDIRKKLRQGANSLLSAQQTARLIEYIDQFGTEQAYHPQALFAERSKAE